MSGLCTRPLFCAQEMPVTAQPERADFRHAIMQPGYAFVKNNELTVNIEGFAFGLRPLGAGVYCPLLRMVGY